MSDTMIQKVEAYAKKIMSGVVAHDFRHADRVRNWALRLAKEENFKDLAAVQTAALLHDIGLSRAGDRNLHGAVGAEMAEKFLTENRLLPRKSIDEVCNAIRYHNKNREGQGKLLKILRDADMMDLFGAIGVIRASTDYASHPEYDPADVRGETWQMTAADFDKRFDSGVGIGNFITDQLNFQISCYDNLSTAAARRLAKPRVAFMVDFMNRLSAEVGK